VVLVPYRYYYLAPFQNILPCPGVSDAGRCYLVTMNFSLLNSTTMVALCLMVHLAYSDRDAISGTTSALVLEDSARGKACVWRFQSTSSPGISRDSPPFVVWNWILYTKDGYFSEENHGSIVYCQWLNQRFSCREHSSGLSAPCNLTCLTRAVCWRP